MNRWSTPGEAYAYETGYIEGRADAVKHGRWRGKPIAGYSTVRCSVCGAAYTENSGRWSYCPNCGAKMDGDVE